MDVQGRITFNSELREELGMNGSPLRLFSELNHIEILTDSVYQKRRKEALATAVAKREAAEGYGLK